MFGHALACHPVSCVRARVSRMSFVADLVTVRQVVFQYVGSRVSASSIIPSTLHTRLHINITAVRRKFGVKPWNVQCNYVSDTGGRGGQSSIFVSQ
jgi:hypothetical protein